MNLSVSKALVGVASMVMAMSVPLAAGAVTADDVDRAPLYRDGSISCSGADDTSRRGGQVVVLPQPGKVQFKVKLRNAQPNTLYSLAISREPNCASAQFYSAQTTDENGDADFYGTYNISSGNRNLLFDLVTNQTVTQARNREIGTQDFHINVP
jgi:hypothetical protein